MARIAGIDRVLEQRCSSYLSRLRVKLVARLEEVLQNEELLWFQRARTKWIAHGDRNTRYFHACTLSRRKRNRINALRLPNGSWCTNQSSLQNLAVSYFRGLFSAPPDSLPLFPIVGHFQRLSYLDAQNLVAPDWAQFSSILPPSLVLRIATIKPPFESDLEGVPGWRWDPLHSFLVRSAYSSLTGAAHAADSEDKGWSLIGKFKGSPRVRSFLWLVYWDSILTNHERVRRFLTSDASCSYCGTVVEDTLHVLWDCPAATAIWSTVIKPGLMGEFCSLDTRKWLHMNLDGGCRFPRNPLH
ncbi:hypothetical protein V6N13_092406 [Hibiscus sabdariffa]